MAAILSWQIGHFSEDIYLMIQLQNDIVLNI